MEKIFLSIGTGPGIGLETAVRFAREGWRPVLAARHPERLEEMATAIKQSTGAEAAAYKFDAGAPGQAAALAGRLGGIGVLHYNAACLRPGRLEELSEQELAQDLQTDLTGALWALKAVLPGMRSRRQGTVLLTGGGLALAPSSGYLTLSVAKAGMRCLCQALFPELAADGVHIATVTVKKAVQAGGADTRAVAELFWKLHSQPRGDWTWEESFG